MQPRGSAIPTPGGAFVSPGYGIPAMWTQGTGIPTPGTAIPTPGTTTLMAPSPAGLGTSMESQKANGSDMSSGLDSRCGARLVATVGMTLLLVLTIGAATVALLYSWGQTSDTTWPTYPVEKKRTILVSVSPVPDIRRRPIYTTEEDTITSGIPTDDTTPMEETSTASMTAESPTPPPIRENITLGSPPPGMKRYQFIQTPLVCVYGTGLNTTAHFPEEGICQLFIFDSLHKEGKNPWNNPGAELQVFLEHARNYSASQFGFSFDFQNRRELAQALSDGTAVNNVGKYWNENIHHYGMLDISPYHETEADVLKAVQLFQHLYPVLESRASSGVSTHVVFGFSPISEKWISFIPSLFEKFRPDIFILRGHYSLINHDKRNCKILPVTLMEDVPEAPFTLVTAHNALKEVAAKASGNDMSLAVSVSAAGRWYRPLNYARKKEHDYNRFEPCTRLPKGYGQFGSIVEPEIEMDFMTPTLAFTDYGAEHKYSYEKGLLIVYDTDRSFKNQLCSLKQNMTEVTYGVAVFDMEYDDWTKTSYRKAFYRLRILQEMTEYFRTSEAFDIDHCTGLHVRGK